MSYALSTHLQHVRNRAHSYYHYYQVYAKILTVWQGILLGHYRLWCEFEYGILTSICSQHVACSTSPLRYLLSRHSRSLYSFGLFGTPSLQQRQRVVLNMF